ncbi:MAG: transposase [Planctomycetes bacterium]|nr:transposase [Planctomycetota bacterium]
MSELPLAYHITFGTYGTRLHGDPKGTVDRTHNRPGDPILGQNDAWMREEQSRMRFAAIFLTDQQRQFVEGVFPELCVECQWQYHVVAVAPDHVHALLTTRFDAKAVRKLLKRRLSQTLSERWPLVDGQVWWASGGSIKWIWNESYLSNVYNYIERQRFTPPDEY